MGFIHESERREEPRLGEVVEGRVVRVKDNGGFNMSLGFHKRNLPLWKTQTLF